MTELIVESVTPLTDSILKIIVRPDKELVYQAGQYIEIKLDSYTVPLSIANAPLGAKTLELHIRHAKDNEIVQALLQTIKTRGKLFAGIAKGACTVDTLDAQKPILFIAGGTGFAPVKAIIESLLYEGDNRLMHLMWLANKSRDFYLDDIAIGFAKHMENFAYTPLLSSRDNIHGIGEALQTSYEKKLTGFQAVLAGPFEMVFQIRDVLTSLGMNSQDIYSDAFE